MKASVDVKLGLSVYHFESDEKNEMESLQKIIVLGNPPRHCESCNNDSNFKFTSNKDKEGNIYVNVKCVQCGARAKLGQYKTGGFFWHRFEKYEPKKEEKNEQ